MTGGEKTDSRRRSVPLEQRTVGVCEDCLYYDYDEEYEEYSCQMDLDEDEMVSFLSGRRDGCPYYRYYDEYKSVHKQI